MRDIVTSALHLPLILGLGLAACASTTPSPGLESYTMGSGYSSLGSGSSEPRTPPPAGIGMQREEAGLIVRPDTLAMEARIQEEDANAGQALAHAQAAAAELTARLQQATGGAATLTPCGTQVTTLGGQGKTITPPTFRVEIQGRVEIALAPALDYWQRSALVVAMVELSGSYERAGRDKAPGSHSVWVGQMRVVVRTPESYRAKLTEQWVQRTHAFAAAAQAREAPLYLLDCAPPGEITQKQVGLEEVALGLVVNCRLGSPKGPSAVLPPPR